MNNSGGIGFSSLLTVAFIVLKLCHVINWHWIWILSPLWINICLWLIVVSVLWIYLEKYDRS
jgi:hypothetical protein